MLSSLVFVPKEFVKQKLQAGSASGQVHLTAASVILHTLQTQGLTGLYAGLSATLLRNVPSAIIRFGTFEELKRRFDCSAATTEGTGRLALAGGVSGLLASTLTTPFDCLKTRIASGAIDRKVGIIRSLQSVVAAEGFRGLFVGLQGRMIWSILFSAVGFTAFEHCKMALGLYDEDSKNGKETGRII